MMESQLSFFKMHGDGSEVCYKTKNPYTSEDRNIFFMSDLPHLMKTTRNCWSHSHSHGNTRDMWVCFQMCIHIYVERNPSPPPPPKKKIQQKNKQTKDQLIKCLSKQHLIYCLS